MREERRGGEEERTEKERMEGRRRGGEEEKGRKRRGGDRTEKNIEERSEEVFKELAVVKRHPAQGNSGFGIQTTTWSLPG